VQIPNLALIETYRITV